MLIVFCKDRYHLHDIVLLLVCTMYNLMKSLILSPHIDHTSGKVHIPWDTVDIVHMGPGGRSVITHSVSECKTRITYIRAIDNLGEVGGLSICLSVLAIISVKDPFVLCSKKTPIVYKNFF